MPHPSCLARDGAFSFGRALAARLPELPPRLGSRMIELLNEGLQLVALRPIFAVGSKALVAIYIVGNYASSVFIINSIHVLFRRFVIQSPVGGLPLLPQLPRGTWPVRQKERNAGTSEEDLTQQNPQHQTNPKAKGKILTTRISGHSVLSLRERHQSGREVKSRDRIWRRRGQCELPQFRCHFRRSFHATGTMLTSKAVRWP
jgi:hypothetical protein